MIDSNCLSIAHPLTIPADRAHDPSVAEKDAIELGSSETKADNRRKRFFYVRHLHGMPSYGRAVRGIARCAGAFVPVCQPARFRPPRLAAGRGFSIRNEGGSHACIIL